MTQFRIVLVLGIVGIATCMLLVVMMGQRIELVAQEELSLYDKAENGQVIAKIQSGEKVEVVACEDLKHYIVPVIRLAGKAAYVVDGKFHLERKKVWDFDAGPLSFSCS